MRIYIARHAERVDGSEDSRISAHGWDTAREAGTWLASDGARLGRVVVTRRQRTAETAQGILEGMVGAQSDWPPLGRRPGFPAARGALAPYLDTLAAEPAAGDVLLVVHGPTQDRVEDEHGGRDFGVPAGNRGAVFRLERVAGAWRCTGAWPGRAPRRGWRPPG